MRPKKRFGQNFLYDPAIAERIVREAGPLEGRTVVELGAGKGILTRPLALACGRLIALELDRELHAELEAEFASQEDGRVEILPGDFTKETLTRLLATRGLERCVLVGNIPYHLTREVLFDFLVDEHEMIESAVLMVQREVGERVASAPGNRVYGVTSVVLQSLYEVRSLFKVLPGSFNPRPRVTSLVLKFAPLARRLVEGSEFKSFVALVRNLFQQRRKTVQNTLKASYSLAAPELRQVEAASGVDLKQRPEALSNGDFLRLNRAVTDVVAVG